MEKLELKIDKVGEELTIRQGTAAAPLPLKEPNIVELSGDIHSISNFLKVRRPTEANKHETGLGLQEVNVNEAVVEADRFKRTIVLKLDPENHYGATVTGKLESSEELKQFHINKEKKFSRAELLKLVKFSRIFFNDKDQHTKLIDGLSKLRIKTESELKQENDNRGNRASSFEQKVIDDSGFLKIFGLLIPIFKGFDKVLFNVEICYEPSESGILFWLESPELYEAEISQVDKIFDDELKSCEGFVIINK